MIDRSPPPLPTQISPSPTLTPTSSGFEVQPTSISEQARSNLGQIALHTRLRRLIIRLQTSIAGIRNSHGALAEEFEDYCTFLAEDITTLDITSLWCVGSGLNALVKALNQTGANVMTPELEPEILARFQMIINDHTAFIIGFPEGKELHERVLRGREAAEANPSLPEIISSVLSPMENKQRLLAAKARKIVSSLLRGLHVKISVGFDLLTSSSDVARNSIYAFIKFLHPIFIINEAVSIAAILAGAGQTDIISTTAMFLRENRESIAALFINDPQVTDWLVWAIRRINDIWPNKS